MTYSSEAHWDGMGTRASRSDLLLVILMRDYYSTDDDAHCLPGEGCIIVSRSIYRAECVRSRPVADVCSRERERATKRVILYAARVLFKQLTCNK